ncbi:hypothetical protein EMIHUDRAFT_459318 [Emiliania huxleyi CCMP1516]|nr:hypothetical protein EMIHUDRAFT_459318 [Emiliania huxleyi CCMP1516]EOD15480.1 hypothetical protein EMIHUDRAFT_459318 [Emiliania huxleyi CCMP1516]|eukprot:XP_005767909.1 hypothetical protein EMIHUDRAFT_459318 [Emiliania huxleyi CCMP1516]
MAVLALHCSLLAFSSPIVAPPLPQLACSRLRAPLCGPFAAPPAAPSPPRVTIFSLETCDPCKAAKRLFEMLGWEYTEISVTHHPERLDDVRQLVPPGVTSMPQIFFGDHHVGGGSDLAALIMANEHLALYEAAAPSTDPRKRPVRHEEWSRGAVVPTGGAEAAAAAAAIPQVPTVHPVPALARGVAGHFL